MKSAFLFVPVIALLAACSVAEPPAAPPKVVRTLKVGAGALHDGNSPSGAVNTATIRSYSGEVRARIETVLAFRVGGKIVAREVDVGAAVKAGQPLARLDPADVALQAVQAEAQRSLAAADAGRFRDLKAKNFVSQSALDAKETTLKAATAQAALAKNQTAYTTLSSSRAGVIGQVLAEPGQVVGAGQPVFRLAPDGDREIAIALPESEVAGFKLGQPPEVSFWASPAATQKPLQGRLREISPAADPVTRTYAARVSLKNADPLLPLGMSATVRFPSTAASTAGWLIPLAAVFQKDGQPAVWKVGADDTVSLQAIRVTAFTERGALVTEGLNGGEQIVAAGVNLLAAGEKVRTVMAVTTK
ncbi:MAG: efflux RND transporter periplasmic adaptor subunit [Sulfuritalea sp.]|nr:efflux RND transporter periplasmic adaptor subunit [Sulfuritalea sp.]